MSMHTNMTSVNSKSFDGIRIETCANRTTIMSKAQFMLYCGTSGVRPVMRPAKDLAVKVIGGMRTRIGTSMI